MLCKNCGKEIKKKENFCPFCGCRINEQAQPMLQEERPAPSVSAHQESNTAYSSYKDYTNDALVEQLKRIHEIVFEIYDVKGGAADKRNWKLFSKYCIGIFLFAFLFLYCISLLFGYEYRTALTSFFGHVFGFIGVIISIIMIVQNIKGEMARCTAITIEEEAAVNRIIEQNKEILSTIPEEYLNPEMTEYMLKLASTGRADNLKTILEMTSNEQHRKEMEDELNSISSSSKSSAISNKFIVFDIILRRLGL